jgi:hypothetical protein
MFYINACCFLRFGLCYDLHFHYVFNFGVLELSTVNTLPDYSIFSILKKKITLEATKTLNDYCRPNCSNQKVAEKVLEPAAQTFMQDGSETVAASFGD